MWIVARFESDNLDPGLPTCDGVQSEDVRDVEANNLKAPMPKYTAANLLLTILLLQLVKQVSDVQYSLFDRPGTLRSR